MGIDKCRRVSMGIDKCQRVSMGDEFFVGLPVFQFTRDPSTGSTFILREIFSSPRPTTRRWRWWTRWRASWRSRCTATTPRSITSNSPPRGGSSPQPVRTTGFFYGKPWLMLETADSYWNIVIIIRTGAVTISTTSRVLTFCRNLFPPINTIDLPGLWTDKIEIFLAHM